MKKLQERRSDIEFREGIDQMLLKKSNNIQTVGQDIVVRAGIVLRNTHNTDWYIDKLTEQGLLPVSDYSFGYRKTVMPQYGFDHYNHQTGKFMTTDEYTRHMNGEMRCNPSVDPWDCYEADGDWVSAPNRLYSLGDANYGDRAIFGSATSGNAIRFTPHDPLEGTWDMELTSLRAVAETEGTAGMGKERNGRTRGVYHELFRLARTGYLLEITNFRQLVDIACNNPNRAQ